MSNEAQRRSKARLQIALVAIVFALPLAAAVWMYYAGSDLQPVRTTNHGRLVQPVVNLSERLGASPLFEATEDYWAMVYVADDACGDPCRDALFKQRQMRLMLGNDMSRVQRVLLHGSEAPDTLFLEQEQAGLIALEDEAALGLLAGIRPRDLADGGFYLLDPLGNVVMYFPPDILPRDLVEDVEHLLDLSRIG